MSTFVKRKQASLPLTVSFQKFLSSTSLLLLSLCTSVYADYDPINATQVGFVAFEIGEYEQEKTGQIDYLTSQLQKLPDDIDIQLTGHSHSIEGLASESSAIARAQLVRDKLIENGIKAESISLHSDVRNSVPQEQLLHGVSIHVLMLPKADLVNVEKSAESNLPSDKQPPLIADPLAATPTAQREDVPDPDSKSCAKVTFTQGSLADNIKREIGHCGYVMGNWRFGSKDDLIDWDIPFQYSTYVDDEIIGLLQLIESNYEIRAHIHKLDKSIDFLPSIKDRGSYE
jgi:hypothetical protein